MNDMSACDLATVFEVHVSTVYRWLVKVLDAPVNPVQRRAPGRKRVCSPEAEDAVCRWMVEDPGRRQIDAVAMLRDVYRMNVSQQSVSNILRRHDITRKRMSFVNVTQRGHDEEVAAFQGEISQLPHQDWMAMDESGFNLDEAPCYGYSKRGTPAVASQSSRRGKHYSLLLTLRWSSQEDRIPPRQTGEGDSDVVAARLMHASRLLRSEVPPPRPVVAWALTDRSINAVTFQRYLAEAVGRNVAAHRTGAARLTLVLNNARIHHATKVCVANGIPTIAQTASAASIDLKYMPPYCPFLNPVEHAFKLIKNDFVRPACPKTERDLREAVARGIASLTPQKVNNLFEHCFTRSVMPTLTAV